MRTAVDIRIHNHNIKPDPPANIDDCWLELVADPELLELAFAWCCRSRQHFPPSADIWWVRERWHSIKPQLIRELLEGSFHFQPMVRYRTQDEDQSRAVWSAIDAIVLKAIAMLLGHKLAAKLSPNCMHLAGNGGVSGMAAKLRHALPRYRYYYKSDIASYYSSIQHQVLISQLRTMIADERLLALISESIVREELVNGWVVAVSQGIPLGSPLSPLLSAIYLLPLDRAMHKVNLVYARFMDDFIILFNRRSLRSHLQQIIAELMKKLGLILHPTKTSMGTISQGFSILG